MIPFAARQGTYEHVQRQLDEHLTHSIWKNYKINQIMFKIISSITCKMESNLKNIGSPIALRESRRSLNSLAVASSPSVYNHSCTYANENS